MKPKASLKMIATELDVSVSTVSKALKDSKEISDSTKQKVFIIFLQPLLPE
jgi:LacI family transcriptional regulator